MRLLIRSTLEGIAFVALLILAYGAVDINDRIADHSAGMARADYARWVNESCLPLRPDERAVARIDADGKLRCSIFGDVLYGKAGRVISVAVMERP